MERVRVGVVGVGRLGRYHLQNYLNIPQAQLVGVHDIDPTRMQQPREMWGVRPYSTLAALLQDVEAISIAVPTTVHHEVAKTTFDAGVHALVEKPIASSLAQADEMIEHAVRQRLVLRVGHVERFNPAILALRGANLSPRFIESHRLAPFDPRGTDVPVILDLMIHDIDLILSLVPSAVKRIDARGVAVVSDDADIANARIEFEDRCVANVTASRISQKKMRKLRLFQPEAYVSVDMLQGLTEVFRLEKGKEPPPEKNARMLLGQIDKGQHKRAISYERLSAPETNALETELRNFLDAVRAKPNIGVTGPEARKALAVALEIERLVEEQNRTDSHTENEQDR